MASIKMVEFNSIDINKVREVLEKSGIKVTQIAWDEYDDEDFCVVVITPLVDEIGLKPAYQQVIDVISKQIPNYPLINVGVTLYSPHHPLAKRTLRALLNTELTPS